MMSRTTRLKNAIRRLPDYWWLIQLIWVIALILGILWLIWTAPSEEGRYIYTGVIGSIIPVVLAVVILGALPLGILLQAIKQRSITRALLFGFGYGVAILMFLAFLGPKIGELYEFAIVEDDSIKHDGTVYLLVHDTSAWRPHFPTYYLLQCDQLFKPCRKLHHFSPSYNAFTELTQGSSRTPDGKLTTEGGNVLVLLDGNLVYTYQAHE